MAAAEVNRGSSGSPKSVWIVAVASFLVHWYVSKNYGFHRDELYYITGGWRRDWGYVDHPPLVPWLAAWISSATDLSLRGLRLLPSLGGALSVVLAASFCRAWGGGVRAQRLAALATILCPFFFFAHTVFQTNLFDQIAWNVALLALAWALVRISEGGEIGLRTWILVGLGLFFGALAKYTIAVLCLGIGLAVLLVRRRELARPGLYVAAALAILGAAPSVWWQASHGWPFLEFGASKEYYAPWAFVALLLGMFGPGAVPLLWTGLKRLWETDARPIGVIVVSSLALFLVLGTKPYYANPLFVVLFGAGAVALAKTRRAWPEWLLVANLSVLPMLLPVLPLEMFARIPDPIGEVSETVGWEELVRQVRQSHDRLTEAERQDLVIIASNYGQAAALEIYWQGDRPPVLCGQNSYAFWMHEELAAAPPITSALVLGYSERRLREWFAEVTPLEAITNRWGVENAELRRSVWLVAGPRLSDDELLAALVRFD